MGHVPCAMPPLDAHMRGIRARSSQVQMVIVLRAVLVLREGLLFVAPVCDLDVHPLSTPAVGRSFCKLFFMCCLLFEILERLFVICFKLIYLQNELMC